ncbi:MULTISPECIES: hypothetical protein [Nocardia]|uniref:hypothetical protein n=1 Tax=Nocardia TaxID=1817 RepID=UPI001300A187|nr:MULTISPECIES: hypothetical protein [Nocardia]
MSIALSGDLEKLAAELGRLVDDAYRRAEKREALLLAAPGDIPDTHSMGMDDHADARAIGRRIYSEGGSELLGAVRERVAELCDAPGYLDFWWKELR